MSAGIKDITHINGLGSFINIDFDVSALERAAKSIAGMPEKIQKAASRAVNRSLDTYKTYTLRETTRKYFVKRKDIADSLTLHRPFGTELYGSMLARGKRKSLLDYKVNRPSSVATSIRPGTFKGAVKKLGGLKHLPGVIRINTRGGVLYPIIITPVTWRYLHSPSVPQLAKNPETVAEAEKQARETFERRLQHECKRAGILL